MLTEEAKAIAELVRRYVRQRLQPLESEVEAIGDIPKDLRDQLRKEAMELGIWACMVPTEYGGVGLDLMTTLALEEELGHTSIALGEAVLGTCPTVLYHGSEAQKERWLYPFLRGDKEWSFAMTEPNAGSDVKAMKTTAVLSSDGNWRISGSKTFITKADIADYCILFARAKAPDVKGHGITAFVVDRGTPGFTVGRKIQTMGVRGHNQCELFFEDCVVPDDCRIGPLGQGLRLALGSIAPIRLGLNGNRCVGMAQRALNLSIAYAQERTTFGRPIGARQAVQWMLVDMATSIHSTRLVVYEAARSVVENRPGADVQVAMAKLQATEMVGRVVDMAIQIHGGMGFTTELPLERMYRDARVMRLWDGTSEIQKMIIARGLLGSVAID